jgi:sugar diacid utilization regulator
VGSVETTAATERIVKALASRRQELATTTLRQIRDEIPAYARIEDAALLSDITEHVAENHDALRESLARGRPVAAEDLAFIRPHAALRAQRGMALADFMHAFLIGQRVIWDAVQEHAARDEEVYGAALSSAGMVMAFLDHASTHAADAFLEEQQQMMAESDRVRRDLLEDLLAGRRPAPGPRLAAARAAGLDADSACQVIVAVPRRQAESEYALRSAGSVLARALAKALPPLLVVRHDEIVIVCSVAGAEAPKLGERLEQAWRALVEQGLRLAVGTSTVHSRPAELPDAYREACLAAESQGPAGGVLALSELSAFDYLTLSGDGTAQRLIAPEIRRFLAEDATEGGALTATLLAYAAADLNTKLAAERLFLHVNTAHYRLRRIAERTGCDLRRLADVVELLIAIRLARADASQPMTSAGSQPPTPAGSQPTSSAGSQPPTPAGADAPRMHARGASASTA